MRLLPDRNPVDQFPNRDQTFFLLLEFGIARPHGVSFDGFRDREFLLSEPAIRIPIQSAPKSCAKMGFPVGLGTGRHHHLQPAVGDCGSIGEERVVAPRAARGIEPPGFRDSQRLVVGYGNYRGGSVPLPVVRPWRRTVPCSLPCSLRLQMGALEPASSWGSSAPLAGGAVQVG